MKLLRISGLILFGYLLLLAATNGETFRAKYLIIIGVLILAAAGIITLRTSASPTSIRRTLLVIVLLGGLARFLWAAYVPTRPVSDFRRNHERALQIIENRIPEELSKNPRLSTAALPGITDRTICHNRENHQCCAEHADYVSRFSTGQHREHTNDRAAGGIFIRHPANRNQHGECFWGRGGSHHFDHCCHACAGHRLPQRGTARLVVHQWIAAGSWFACPFIVMVAGLGLFELISASAGRQPFYQI